MLLMVVRYLSHRLGLPLVGWVLDLTGNGGPNYQVAFLFSLGFALLAALLAWLDTPRAEG